MTVARTVHNRRKSAGALNSVVVGDAATPVGPWEYASLAAAESSGDPWVNGDQVTITGGAVFLYISNLAVSGYSGLIHKEPYGASITTLSAASVEDSFAAGSDPDTWGWNDESAGVKTTDYDFDTNSGKSRLIQLTASGMAAVRQPAVGTPANYAETFSINDAISHTSDVTGGNGLTAGLNAYIDASNIVLLVLRHRWIVDNTNWSINHTDGSTHTASTQAMASASRIFLYLKSGRWAMWLDADSTPELSGTVPRTAAVGMPEIRYQSSGNTTTATSGSTLMGNTVIGRMTTA
jgi:hypothetical protein